MFDVALRDAGIQIVAARAGLAGLVASGSVPAGTDVRKQLHRDVSAAQRAVTLARSAGCCLSQPDAEAAIIILQESLRALECAPPASHAERDAQLVGLIELLRPAVEVLHRRITVFCRQPAIPDV